MKKHFTFFLFFLLLLNCANAQKPTVRHTHETAVKSWNTVDFTLFGANSDHLYAYSSNVSLLDGRWTTNHLTLYEVDKEGNITAQKELQSLGKKVQVRKAFLNGDSIDLLVNSHFRKPEENKILHIRLSINDLKSTQEITNPYTEEMVGNFFTSPDTSWIVNLKNTETELYSLTLYSRNFEQIYSKQLILKNIQNIFVTNEAEIILLGISDNSDKIYFQIIDEGQEQSYTADMNFNNIASIRLANYKNGRIYAGGLTFHWNDKKDTKLYDGCHTLMFDTKTNELKTDRMFITKKEFAYLGNNSIPKKNADHVGAINSLPMADAILSTEKNTVFAYHYVPAVLEENNFFHGGLFLFSINDDGQIGWKHFFRRGNRMPNELFMLQYLIEYKGEPCIVYSTADKTAMAENDEQQVDLFRISSILSKPATVMVTMHADGSITKNLLDNQTNKLPYTTIENQGERSFMMFRGSSIEFLFVE